MIREAENLCQGRVYPGRGTTGVPRFCKNLVTTPGGFCFAHDPGAIEKRDEKSHRDALQRKKTRDLRQRKLLLIPLLDIARKSRRKLDGPRAKMGAQVIIKLIEWEIREN